MAFLAKNSRRVDVWALPGKHLNEYDQIIVAAVVGHQPDPNKLYQDILSQKTDPLPLTVQDDPIYTLPAAHGLAISPIYLATKMIQLKAVS